MFVHDQPALAAAEPKRLRYRLLHAAACAAPPDASSCASPPAGPWRRALAAAFAWLATPAADYLTRPSTGPRPPTDPEHSAES